MTQLRRLPFLRRLTDPQGLHEGNADKYQAMADSLMSAGYIPDSGAAGAFAMIGSALAGNHLQNRANLARNSPGLRFDSVQAPSFKKPSVALNLTRLGRLR
jgi:hypothetical protein